MTSPSTDADEPIDEFAAQVLADLLHEIEVRNANRASLRNRVFHVSHAWIDGPTLFVVYTTPPSDRIWGLVRDTRRSLVNSGPWNDSDSPGLYYYLLDLEEGWPGNFSREPGEPEIIWWTGDFFEDLAVRADDIPDRHQYTRPPVDPAWIRHEQPTTDEPRRYADPPGPSPRI